MRNFPEREAIDVFLSFRLKCGPGRINSTEERRYFSTKDSHYRNEYNGY